MVERKTLFTWGIVFLILIIGVVQAYTQAIPNPGHGGTNVLVSVNGVEKTLQQAIDDKTLGGCRVECRVCFQETEGSSQCQGTRASCSGWSSAPGWSAVFRDDTDNRGGGCYYQWKVECQCSGSAEYLSNPSPPAVVTPPVVVTPPPTSSNNGWEKIAESDYQGGRDETNNQISSVVSYWTARAYYPEKMVASKIVSGFEYELDITTSDNAIFNINCDGFSPSSQYNGGIFSSDSTAARLFCGDYSLDILDSPGATNSPIILRSSSITPNRAGSSQLFSGHFIISRRAK